MLNFPNPLATQFDPPRPTRSVWVRLDTLYSHPPDAAETSTPDGWDLVGNAPSVARADTWIRSARGMWLALCNFEITSADGLRSQWFHEQLVPAHAMSLRDRG